MIVTRQRKRQSHAGRILFPLLALGLLAAALAFPPSHRLIADGPLHPVWAGAEHVGGVLERPLTFAAQQQSIADRNREIRDLNGRLDAQRQAKVAADARAAQLQQQVATLANQPEPTPVPDEKPVAASAGSANAATAGGLGAVPGGAAASSADEKRVAATWAAMEPEKAAAVVLRLPDGEATRILSQMDADSAGAIMDALPPAVAARLSRAVAQVSSASGR